MGFPNFDNTSLEHRELRRLSVAHALFLSGDLMIDLDLSGMGLPGGLGTVIEEAMDILGEDHQTLALEIIDDVGGDIMLKE